MESRYPWGLVKLVWYVHSILSTLSTHFNRAGISPQIHFHCWSLTSHVIVTPRNELIILLFRKEKNQTQPFPRQHHSGHLGLLSQKVQMLETEFFMPSHNRLQRDLRIVTYLAFSEPCCNYTPYCWDDIGSEKDGWASKDYTRQTKKLS